MKLWLAKMERNEENAISQKHCYECEGKMVKLLLTFNQETKFIYQKMLILDKTNIKSELYHLKIHPLIVGIKI